MQSGFQLLNGVVMVFTPQRVYEDTKENFIKDYGKDIFYGHSFINYNQTLHVNVVDNGANSGDINTEYDMVIAGIADIIAAKEKRTYVAPPEPTLDELKEQKTKSAKEAFAAKRDAVRFIKLDDTHTYGFDCASEDITNFLAADKALESGSATTLYKVWISKTEKGIVQLTKEQMQLVFEQVRILQFAAYQWLDEVLKKIEECKSKEELEKISLE